MESYCMESHTSTETKGKDKSGQFAEVKAIQLLLDITEQEMWPELSLCMDSWIQPAAQA